MAHILTEMGLEMAGAPGTTAALALLNDAVKKGGVMASNHVGGLSGALGASISLSGPPIAIFMTAGGVPKNVFRSSTALYFLLLNTVTLFTFGARGALDARFLSLLAWLLPPLVLGTASGVRLGGRVPEAKFRAVVIVLIFVSGLSLLL